MHAPNRQGSARTSKDAKCQARCPMWVGREGLKDLVITAASQRVQEAGICAEQEFNPRHHRKIIPTIPLHSSKEVHVALRPNSQKVPAALPPTTT